MCKCKERELNQLHVIGIYARRERGREMGEIMKERDGRDNEREMGERVGIVTVAKFRRRKAAEERDL